MSLKTKLIRGLVITLVSIGIIIGAYFYGRSDQKAHCDSAALTQELKEVNENEEVNRAVKRLDESDLDSVLDLWMQ